MPVTTRLIEALFAAGQVHPGQRAGQLIANAVSIRTGSSDPFYVEDAELTAALNEYAKEGES